MEDTTEQLTERLASDLDDGFTELVRVHAPAVHAFLFRVSGSATEADDLGQDTFLRAYTALRGYSPDRRRELRPRAWLMMIATNVWRNHVRTNVRHPVSATRAEDACGNWPDASPGPEERAATSADRALLVTALAKLPEKHRVAVVMRHVVGMSYNDMAEAQDCPVGTIKAQVSRGIGALREILTSVTTAHEEVIR
jgi:RNA polymerase sigma-70 factor (ECF subfamily)